MTASGVTPTAGGIGGSSSFGSYITSAEGTGGCNSSIVGSFIGGTSFPTNQCIVPAQMETISISNYNYYFSVGGDGADGFDPMKSLMGSNGGNGLPVLTGEYLKASPVNTFSPYINMNNHIYNAVLSTSGAISTGGASTTIPSTSSLFAQFGQGYVRPYVNSGTGYTVAIGGAAGLGYGAGGGGGATCFGGYYGQSGATNGGNSGIINIHQMLLTSTSEIAVTVGTGGAGGGNSSYCIGGKGASGCVAIYW